MKKSSNYIWAFLIAFSIHAFLIFLFLNITLKIDAKKSMPLSLNLKELNIQELKSTHQDNQKEEQTKESPKKIEPTQKSDEIISKQERLVKQEKEVQTKKALLQKETQKHSEIKKSQPKIQQEETKAQLKQDELPLTQKETIKETQKEPQIAPPRLDDIGDALENSEISKLYGDEFKSFTKEQKEFLKENLKDIGAITQRYLKYPTIAAKLGQHGVNIVEFFLHPNGDISDLKIIDGSGYEILDKNSIYTIEIAYKEYPRPKSVTKIRIYVHYYLR